MKNPLYEELNRLKEENKELVAACKDANHLLIALMNNDNLDMTPTMAKLSEAIVKAEATP